MQPTAHMSTAAVQLREPIKKTCLKIQNKEKNINKTTIINKQRNKERSKEINKKNRRNQRQKERRKKEKERKKERKKERNK